MKRALFVLFCLAGCTPTPPAVPPAPVPEKAPVPVPVPPPAPPPRPSRWSIATPTHTASFIFESSAIFESRADTLARTDSSNTHLELRVVPRGAAIDVTINTFALTSTATQPLALPAPSRAVGRYDAAGAIVFGGPGQSSCTALTSAAFEATRDLWVKWPAEVVVGTQWSDSATIAACRDGIPLQVTIVRDYRVRVVAPDSTDAIDVERKSRVRISGHGTLRGDTVTMSGEGSGTATIKMAPHAGWPLDGNGTSTLELRAAGKNRTQVLNQRISFSFRQVSETAR